ncbi:MAG: hypothetical protein IJ318_01190 [Clostridia bacterium]|nr:hypothetical protein [Clostridia bacterium]
MKYITNPKLTEQEIFNFISSVLSNENALFNNATPTFINFSSFLQLSSRDENGIVVSSNYNLGLVPYNIFTLTDFEFKSLYPLCHTDYSTAWQNYLANRFPTYSQDLKKYLKRHGKNK